MGGEQKQVLGGQGSETLSSPLSIFWRVSDTYAMLRGDLTTEKMSLELRPVFSAKSTARALVSEPYLDVGFIAHSGDHRYFRVWREAFVGSGIGRFIGWGVRPQRWKNWIGIEPP